MNEEKKTSPSNSKLSTIFLVVLGLHVVVIVLILAYNLLKGDTEMEEENYFGSVEQSAPYRPMSPLNERPEPRLETGNSEGAQPVTPENRTSDRPMSMPPSNDPIWAMGTMEPRQPEQIQETVERAAETAVAEVNTPAQPAPLTTLEEEVRQTASTQSYKVVKGDSLSKIGSQFGVSVAELKRINGLEGSLIRVGQTLKVPGAGTPNAIVASTPQPVKATTAGATHVVQKGETLWKIARHYQVNPNELARVNGISDPTLLKIGTSLNIPGAPQMAQPVQGQQAPRVENADMAMRAE
jgi:LysM repeat protein